MRNPDVIPRADAQFDTFQQVLVKRTLAKAAAWQIPPAHIQTLQQYQQNWNLAWQKAKDKRSRSSVDVETKNIARKEYEKPLRWFIQVYIQLNAHMNDADKISCGIKPHKKERKRVPVPDTAPHLTFLLTGDRTYNFHYRQALDQNGSSKRRRPTGIDCMQMYYTIGEKPTEPEDCNKRVFARRTPFHIQFPVSAKGKTAYFYVRWVNTKGEPGLWSKMYRLEI